MKKPSDLADAENAVKAAEAKVGFVEAHIILLDIEIGTLTRLKVQLIENIEILKEKKIVALAEAYRKAKTDLAKTEKQLGVSEQERETLSKSLKNSQTVLQKCHEAYDIILGRYQNNVLIGNFGKKNG